MCYPQSRHDWVHTKSLLWITTHHYDLCSIMTASRQHERAYGALQEPRRLVGYVMQAMVQGIDCRVALGCHTEYKNVPRGEASLRALGSSDGRERTSPGGTAD